MDSWTFAADLGSDEGPPSGSLGVRPWETEDIWELRAWLQRWN